MASRSVAASPDAEFDIPYSLRVLPGGTVVEISGGFSWAVPQNFAALLTEAPRAHSVPLDSPGGQVQAALAVAATIRAHGLDTFVTRLCASACTLAFLGGQRRYVASGGRIGFHQAHAPGVAPEQLDPLLRKNYQLAGVPAGFIAHVLRTPPQALWFPTRDELWSAGFITGPVPSELDPVDRDASPMWGDDARLLAVTSDAALMQFAAAVSKQVAQLQAAGADICLAWANKTLTEPWRYLSADTKSEMEAARTRVWEDAGQAAPLDNAQRAAAVAVLSGSLGDKDVAAAQAALVPSGDGAGFCQALRSLLDAALTLPAGKRGPALRALLTRG